MLPQSHTDYYGVSLSWDVPGRGGLAATECPTYLGTEEHHGCRLDDLSVLPHRIYIIVTGVSQEAEVQFHDVILNSKLIGEVTVR